MGKLTISLDGKWTLNEDVYSQYGDIRDIPFFYVSLPEGDDSRFFYSQAHSSDAIWIIVWPCG